MPTGNIRRSGSKRSNVKLALCLSQTGHRERMHLCGGLFPYFLQIRNHIPTVLLFCEPAESHHRSPRREFTCVLSSGVTKERRKRFQGDCKKCIRMILKAFYKKHFCFLFLFLDFFLFGQYNYKVGLKTLKYF